MQAQGTTLDQSQAAIDVVAAQQAEFAEELKRLREIMQTEYEAKVRSAFEELEELKVVLEENAREKQAKNDRTMQRQLEDKDSEIDELNTLVAKLRGKISEQKASND